MVGGPADGVATLTLNRPEKRNALSIAVRDEVSADPGLARYSKGMKSLAASGTSAVFVNRRHF